MITMKNNICEADKQGLKSKTTLLPTKTLNKCNNKTIQIQSLTLSLHT